MVKRVKTSSVVESQLPAFVREDFPLVAEFLQEYYKSQENPGGTLDILQNIDKYVKVEEMTNLNHETTLTADVTRLATTINVEDTSDFPDNYGLIQIDSEIITYTGKTSTTFTGCVRGFSGISSYRSQNRPDTLVFSDTSVATHTSGASVKNLSVLFLKEFLKKTKLQVIPGFEDRELYSGLNENLFIKQAKDFYQSKGTDQSFEILFRALYGVDVEVLKPRDNLFQPSDAQYSVTQDLVVEAVTGDPFNLENKTLFQNEGNGYQEARGSVTKVEKFSRQGKDYYKLSLDYDFDKDINVFGSLFGEFKVHPKTRVITAVSAGSTILDVDSTVGFGTTGTLVVNSVAGTPTLVAYTSKTLNQFFGCSNVPDVVSETEARTNVVAFGYEGPGLTNPINIRIGAVLSEIEFDSNTNGLKDDDVLKIKTLGKRTTDSKSNNWVFNIPSVYDAASVSLIDISDYTYRFTTYDRITLYDGDSVDVLSSTGVRITSQVTSIENENTFQVRIGQPINEGLTYTVSKNLTKVNATNFPQANNNNANVQNVYLDPNNDVYVASPSLPAYFRQELKVRDRSITFSGTYSDAEVINIGFHGLYTGDSIVYVPGSGTNKLNISAGTYFVKRVSANEVSIYRSRANIFNNIFIAITGTVTNNKFEIFRLSGQTLESQKLIRKFPTPEDSSSINKTTPGQVGMLINGVEVLNYKSPDSIFYGPIQKIVATAGGSGYDVVNPPILQITDPVGTGATGLVSVEGSFEEIRVIDGGFDYIGTPTVSITGGGGKGATAEVDMLTVKHINNFNAFGDGLRVDLTNNTIGFSSFHKFRNGEAVIYSTGGSGNVGGLSTDSKYYVSTLESDTYVKLHYTEEDAIAGINTVNLTSYGSGTHSLTAVQRKRVINGVKVKSPGTGYKNRAVHVRPESINVYSNTIDAVDHGYADGDLIVYTPTGTVADGLEDGSRYYVTKVNDHQFRLSAVGVGTTVVKDFYYTTKQHVNITSSGSGTHTFNYEPIRVQVNGVIGITTTSSQDFTAKLQPIVRGEITGISLFDGGVGYGSSEIIGDNRQPLFTLNRGSAAILEPVVINGSIVEVVIKSGGSGYNAPPSLNVLGDGQGAELTPIVTNGSITGVFIANSGYNYTNSKTSIDIQPAGSGASLQAKIKNWTINLFERALSVPNITDDDGYIAEGLNPNYGLQYTHIYAPRKFRQNVYREVTRLDKQVFVPDLIVDPSTSAEIESRNHSPIIGWAYDGNPIYGPYGYDKPDGGVVRAMVSGYERVTPENRPPVSKFPKGFLIDDYIFTGTGDLDKYNGRYCVTPEYPNGTYAYFATISAGSVESVGPFKGYKLPQFPYFIGDEFRSAPIDFNFDKESNQDDYDLVGNKLIRNTTPYNTKSLTQRYPYFLDPTTIQDHDSTIDDVKSGKVESILIKKKGLGYKVDDRVIFDNTGTSGRGAAARVSRIEGVTVTGVSVASTQVTDVEFSQSGRTGVLVGYATQPHNFVNNDEVTISGLSTTNTGLQRFFSIEVPRNTLVLRSGIGTTGATGIVTFISVSGDISDVVADDIYTFDDEKVRVLSVDLDGSRLRVERRYSETVGSAHTASTFIVEDPRRLFVNVGYSEKLDLFPNVKLYFDPEESFAKQAVGVATTSKVTVSFANPGTGATSVVLSARQLYIPNHGLRTNSRLVYNSNGGDGIRVSTALTSQFGTGFNVGITTFTLSNQSIVYAARFTDDIIGIATNPIVSDGAGDFVGIGSTVQGLLFFQDYGSGNKHSLETDYSNTLSGLINRNVVTVSTASTHNLVANETIKVDVFPGITTTIKLSYNEASRRVVGNKLNFARSNVNLLSNVITVPNHGFVTGQKVVYESGLSSADRVITSNTTVDTPTVFPSPLEVERPFTLLATENGVIIVDADAIPDNSIFYVVVLDYNRIQLSETYYNATKASPTVVDMISNTFGALAPINPPVALIRNQTVDFDLSDSSLSYRRGSTDYPAFEFNLYTDSNFKNKFFSSGTSSNFEVTRTGVVGTSGAKVSVLVSDNLPKNLYYKLDPVDTINTPEDKLQILVDDENVPNNNAIIVTTSGYSGNHRITGVGVTSIQYNVLLKPERDSYNTSEAVMKYDTASRRAIGAIKELSVRSGGKGYELLPAITSIASTWGRSAILEASSSSIGRIKSYCINDIGFDYPSDFTLRPTVGVPQVLKLEPLTSIEKIGITSTGIGYAIAPNLIFIDGNTGREVDVDLSYNIGDSFVTINKNSTEIYNTAPVIIPVNNTNGVGISSITYDSGKKNVQIILKTVGYSTATAFPFEVGDRVYVENVSVGVGSTGKGFNSVNYRYKLFTITETDPNIGGANPTITYSLDGDLTDGRVPGSFDAANSSGRVIPEKYFPIFAVTLKKNTFIEGETVISGNKEGIVESWNFRGDDLNIRVTSDDSFEVGDTVRGLTSGSVASIERSKSYDASYVTNATSIVENGFNKDTGVLNLDIQRLHDNDYYQYFSYSVKSEIEIERWNNPVSSLDHTAGFKKFSDLQVVSAGATDSSGNTGIATDQNDGDFLGIANIDQLIDLNCVNDFDLATENNIFIDGNVRSDEIILKSRDIQDYLESIGNRVLMIDDISDQFNDRPRPTRYSVIDEFPLTSFRARKYLLFVRDRRFTETRENIFVSVLHDNQFGYLNQYARVETVEDMGYFDFDVLNGNGRLLFYPEKFRVNNFDITFTAYGLKDGISGVGATALGNVADVRTTSVGIETGKVTPIVSIANTYRASKLLIEITTDDQRYEFDEFTIIHSGNGTCGDIDAVEYAQLTSHSRDDASSVGLGTYSVICGAGNTLSYDVGLSTALFTTLTGFATAPNGTGIGDNGGFAIGPHLKVAGNTGLGTDKRIAITTPLDTQTLDTFVLTGVAGDDSNGGEEPMDAFGRNESLILNYSVDGGSTFIGIGTIIGPGDVSAPLRTYTLPLPSAARTSSTIFQLEQPTSDGSPFDEFGITHIGFTNSGIVAFPPTGDIVVNFHPYPGVAATVDILRVSIADTTATGIGTTTLNAAIIDSHYTSIASTDSPVANTIATYDATVYNGGYYIVTVEDLTNGWSQVSELMVANNEEFNNITEFGEIITMVTLGEFGVRRSGNEVQVTFEPNPDADMEVRVFQNAMRLVDPLNGVTKIDMNNGTVETGAAEYFGTENDIKRAFELTHQSRPIFRRVFDPTSAGIVSITDNTIRIPQNFFVTGEEVQYTAADRFAQPSPIGIATTTIAGVSTDKLPSTLYIVKVDEINIQVSASASEALAVPPTVLDITSVGFGTIHRLDAKKQNTKALVTIDNMIQSPVAGTGVTVGLVTTVQPTTDRITLTGITSIFAGDLLKINDEIMRVSTVGVGTTNVLIVNRPWMGTGLGTHQAGSQVTKIVGNYNILDNQLHFASAPYGAYPLSTTSGPVDERDWTGVTTHSTFSGRVFTRTSQAGSDLEPYTYNTIFDDISEGFNGITTAFVLKSDGNNVTNVAEDNGIILIRDIYQGPRRADDVVVIGGDYELVEGSGITTAIFQGVDIGVKYDNNTNEIPRGGLIVAVGSTQSRGYQPLIGAGATALVSAGGSITAISIGNTGAGYREWYQTEVLIRAYNPVTGTSSTIGVANAFDGHIISTRLDNPGTGYTTTNLPIITIDKPAGYSGIPMVYSQDYPNNSGVGTGLVVDVIVGQGSTVIDFNVVNYGFGYRQGDILTIPRSGIGSIPHDSGIGHIEFTLTVQKTYKDEFSGWSLGNFQRFDDISNLFNGFRTEFPLLLNGVRTSIRAKTGSLLDVQASLLVFINDILQVPGEGYIFNGGSTITFTEAPLGYNADDPYNGDTVKIIFYRGTKDVDVVLVDILETIKPGDTVELYDDFPVYDEDPRLVVDITATDTLETNVYPGPGISTNLSYERALQWCRQTEDKIINDQKVAKDREIYKALINPASAILQDVGVGDTTIYVESVRTFFDSVKENAPNLIKNTLEIISQDSVCAAAATAIVSAAGTISSIVLTDPITGIATTSAGGSGYLSAPDVSISLPIGIGTTGKATAVANISNGMVTSFTITNPGYGYTFTNVPYVMISQPDAHKESLVGKGYKGDFGIIVGIATTTIVGTATTGVKGLVLNLDIEEDSFLRNPDYVGAAISETTIEVGDYFAINNSNLGLGVTALRYADGSVISYGSTFFDGIYQVANVEYGSSLAGTLIEETRYVTIDYEIFDSPVVVGPNDPDGTVITGSPYTFSITETIDSPVEIEATSTARILSGVTLTIDDISRTSLIINDAARAIVGESAPSRITVRVEDYNGVQTQYHPGSYNGRFYGDYSWGKIDIPTRSSTRNFVGYSTEGYVGLSSSPFVRRKNPLKTINYL